MPLFTFVCEKCNTASEVLVRNGEAVECPSCGSKKVSKGMSHFAAVSGETKGPESCGMGNMCCGGSCGFSPN